LDATPITIGRHASNRLVLDDGLASRAHAVVEQTRGGFQVRDLNSSNGTYLNGVKLKSPMPLKAGDQITVGSTRMTVVGNEPPENEVPENDFEELSDEDVVSEPIVVRDSDKIAIGGYEGDYEEALDELVRNLPPGQFEEHEIALVGAKGRV